MNITLYTIGCPKCKVLEIKLNQKKLNYETINDIDIIKEKGITSLPVLEVDDKRYNFSDAVRFLNGVEG